MKESKFLYSIIKSYSIQFTFSVPLCAIFILQAPNWRNTEATTWATFRIQKSRSYYLVSRSLIPLILSCQSQNSGLWLQFVYPGWICYRSIIWCAARISEQFGEVFFLYIIRLQQFNHYPHAPHPSVIVHAPFNLNSTFCLFIVHAPF